MKFTKLFRIVTTLAAIAGLTIGTHAALLSTNLSAGILNVQTGNQKINQIIVANATTNTASVYIYDAPATSLLWTNAAYNTRTLTGPTSVVTTYTNVFGAVETWTNSVLSTTTATVAASATNAWPGLVVLSVPASSTTTYTPSSSVYALRGLLVTNTQTISLTVDYSR